MSNFIRAGYLSVMSWNTFNSGNSGAGSAYALTCGNKAWVIALTPNYFAPVANLIRNISLGITDVRLYLPTAHPRFLSDAYNLSILAFDLKKKLEAHVPVHGYEHEIDTWEEHTVHFWGDTGGFLEFKDETPSGELVSVALDNPEEGDYFAVSIYFKGRRDLFVIHRTSAITSKLVACADPANFLHLPYMRPVFGGLSASDMTPQDDLFRAWQGNIVVNSFTSMEEVFFLRNHNTKSQFRLPPVFSDFQLGR